MRLNIINHIAKKEIISTLRDRRAIISSIVLPLLILPAMMIGMPFLIGSIFEGEQDNISQIAVLGLENMPESLEEKLLAQNTELIAVENPMELVQDGSYQVALEIPANISTKIASKENFELKVYAKEASLKSSLNSMKLNAAISAFKQEIVVSRLADVGLRGDVLEPIQITTIDASSKAEKSSGQMAWLIPFFIAIWSLAGGQITALDATAGEKERGTLEALLASPARRIEIVMGKFLATLFFSLAASTMAIVGYIGSGVLTRNIFSKNLSESTQEIVSAFGGNLNVTFSSISLLFVSSILLAALIAALLISISMFARSYKEAQSYVAPLSMFMVIPAVGLQFSEFFADKLIIHAVPILNVLVLMDKAVKGKAQAIEIIVTWLSMIAIALVLLVFAYRNFKREGVIFRT